jgi:hypothetical protein
MTGLPGRGYLTIIIFITFLLDAPETPVASIL